MIKLVLNSYRTLCSSSPYLSGFGVYMALSLFQRKNSLFSFQTIMVVFTMIVVLLFPNRIMKGMFLCPFNQAQRRQFIKTSIVIKAAFLMSIYFLGIILLCLIHRYSPMVILFGSLYYFMFLLIFTFQSIGFVISKDKKTKEIRQNLNHNYRFYREQSLSVFCMICLVFCLVALSFTEHFTPAANFLHILGLLFNGLFVFFYIKDFAKYVIYLCADYQAIYTPMTKKLRGPGDAYYDFVNE